MLHYLHTTGRVRSRTGDVPTTSIDLVVPKRKALIGLYRRIVEAALPWICILVGGALYAVLHTIVQYVDPTVGWLDLGTLSLSLFAAWSCLLGLGIAGLLPAILQSIGRKGGINEWKSSTQIGGMALVYISYIVLLCILL
jgi:hypothetical protein